MGTPLFKFLFAPSRSFVTSRTSNRNYRHFQAWVFVASMFALATSVRSEAKEPDCVATRIHSTQKLESRCMRMPYSGVTRTYRIYLPKVLKTSMPLVLALHGGSGSGSGMEIETSMQFDRLADRFGFVVVYPDGISRSWNDGHIDLQSSTANEGIDDVAFLRSLVADVSGRFPINRSRVYATGISNGGLMAYRLACNAADVFAAVALVAANLPVELSTCHPVRGISIAIFNGTDDPVMPWLGGEIKALANRHGAVLSTQSTFERWLKLNDCALPSTHLPVNRIEEDGTSIVKHGARDCSDNAEVRLYEILGGGHTWPGGSPSAPERTVGKLSREINAAETIWDFFARHSLQ